MSPRRFSCFFTWLLALLPGLALLVVPAARADAAERVLVMELRQAAGTLSGELLRTASGLLGQRLAAIPGVLVVPEGQAAAAIGQPYMPYRGCAEDSCMVQVGLLAGVEKVVWGYVQPTPGSGLAILLRVVGIGLPGLQGLAAVQCERCSEADLLGRLIAFDPSPLKLGSAGPLPPEGLPAATGTDFTRSTWSDVASAAPRTGWLSLTSTPAGAEVFAGELLLGFTPLKKVELAQGTHQIAFLLADHEPAFAMSQVLPGKQSRLQVTLRPTHGHLEIGSSPPGALILVNGQSLGKAPLPRQRVAVGTYDVVAALEGFQAQQRTVVVRNAGLQKVQLKLKPLKRR